MILWNTLQGFPGLKLRLPLSFPIELQPINDAEAPILPPMMLVPRSKEAANKPRYGAENASSLVGSLPALKNFLFFNLFFEEFLELLGLDVKQKFTLHLFLLRHVELLKTTEFISYV